MCSYVYGPIHGLLEPDIQSLQFKDTKRKESYVVSKQRSSQVISYSKTALCNTFT